MLHYYRQSYGKITARKEKEMENKTTQKVGVPPYMSWKTFVTYLQSLRQNMPPVIDTSGMIQLSGSNRRFIMNALRFLKLIDDRNQPKDNLRALAETSIPNKQTEYQQHLQNVLEEAYYFLFGQEPFDLKTSTPAAFSAKFKREKLSGDTIRKSEKFFLDAAKDADITISPLILQAKKKGPKSSAPRNLRQKSRATINNILPDADPRSVILESLADKFPEFDPSWDTEAQKAWFDMYSRLLNIVDEDKE